jgi:hypothetical protein
LCLSHTVDLGISEFSWRQSHCHLFQIIANRGVFNSISVSNRALCDRAL